jgi:hypothetical protein
VPGETTCGANAEWSWGKESIFGNKGSRVQGITDEDRGYTGTVGDKKED